MIRSGLAALLVFLAADARAVTPEEGVARLTDRTSAAAALDELVAMKEAALPAVIAEATRGKDTKARGWARAVSGSSRTSRREAAEVRTLR